MTWPPTTRRSSVRRLPDLTRSPCRSTRTARTRPPKPSSGASPSRERETGASMASAVAGRRPPVKVKVGSDPALAFQARGGQYRTCRMAPPSRVKSQVAPFFFGAPSPTRASMTSPCVQRTTGPGPSRSMRPSAASADSPSARAGSCSTGSESLAASGSSVCDAAEVGARDEPPDRVAGQRRHDGVRLAAPAPVDRPEPVVAAPPVSVPRPRVAHQKDQLPQRRLDPIEDRAIPDIGELATGGGQGLPADLVDLLVGAELPVARGHGPVPHGLVAAAPVPVAGRPELGTEKAGESGLLRDLAEGAVLVRLVRLDLALRQGPVPMPGPVDEQHLEPAVGIGAEDCSAGRADVRL